MRLPLKDVAEGHTKCEPYASSELKKKGGGSNLLLYKIGIISKKKVLLRVPNGVMAPFKCS